MISAGFRSPGRDESHHRPSFQSLSNLTSANDQKAGRNLAPADGWKTWNERMGKHSAKEGPCSSKGPYKASFPLSPPLFCAFYCRPLCSGCSLHHALPHSDPILRPPLTTLIMPMPIKRRPPSFLLRPGFSLVKYTLRPDYGSPPGRTVTPTGRRDAPYSVS